MNFMISFLGILIYWIIINIETNKREINNKKFESELIAKTRLYKEWESQVTDIEMENNFKFKLASDQIGMYKILSPVVCSIDGFPDKFDNHIEFYDYMRDFPNMLNRIYMAINHKILYNDAKNGIRSPDVYNETLRQRWKLNHEFMKWLDGMVRLDNGRYELCFVKGDKLCEVKNDYNHLIKLNELDVCIGGVYCWSVNTNMIPVF